MPRTKLRCNAQQTNKDKFNFNWDRCNNPEIILVRRMLYDDPHKVLSEFTKQELKKVFLKRIHLFRRHNRSFWKLILEVADDELEKAVAENFREAIKVWPY